MIAISQISETHNTNRLGNTFGKHLQNMYYRIEEVDQRLIRLPSLTERVCLLLKYE